MNQHWHWQTWKNHSYLTCDLLSHWQHGFFTQEFHPRSPEELTTIWRSQGVDATESPSAYRVKQIHGKEVLTPQEIEATIKHPDYSQELAEADAVISDQSQQSVWAASADCTPVLIGDLVTGQVCAIHAGWKGTAQKIVPQAVSRFMKFGSDRSALRIAIGPAISGKIYQVDETVALKVAQTIIDDAQLTSEPTILAKLKELDPSPLFADDLPGKVCLDVPRVNQIQLEQLGIKPEQIAIAPYCTFEHDQLFFSYRRTGEKKVQWSGIVSK